MASYEELLAIFKSLDKNNSGSLNLSELQEGLNNKRGYKFNQKAAKLLLELVDDNGNGLVGFEEFGELDKLLSDLWSVFDSFDLDNSGGPNPKEVKNALNKLGFYISNNQVNAYLDDYDRSGAENVSFDDFIVICLEVGKHSFGADVRKKLCKC